MGFWKLQLPQKPIPNISNPLEKPYQGGEKVELAIPHDLFPLLNQYPRALKPR
jgi:hypothetical protein